MPGEYDSDYDRRYCEICGELFTGGSIPTSWQMYDHDLKEHPQAPDVGCDHVGTGRERKFDGGRCPLLCARCSTIVGRWDQREEDDVAGT